MKSFSAIVMSVCLTMITSFSVYASDCSVVFKGSEVYVSGSAEPETAVGFLMYRTSGDKMDDATYIFQTDTDENGNFETVFYMKDFKSSGEIADVWSDNYSYIISHGETEHSDTIQYLSYIERNKVIKAVNSATDNNVLKDSGNIQRIQAMGAETSAFKTADDEVKEKVAQLMRDNGQFDEFDEKSFIKAFCDAYVITTLNNCQNGADVWKFLSDNTSNGIIISEKIQANKNISTYVGEYIYKRLSYDLLDKINDDIANAEILYNIINADKKSMTDYITQNSEKMGISETSEYKKYISTNLNSVGINEKLILSLKKSPVSDIEAFVSLFKTIVKNYIQTSVNENITGSHGGSSGGSGGASSGKGSGGGLAFTALPSDTTSAQNVSFKDVKADMWYYSYINAIAAKGIVNGFADGTFLPEASVTREQFLKMLLEALEIEPENGKCAFSDAIYGEWYYDYICSAVSRKIISGISENEFGVGESITRQDAAVIIYRALSSQGNLPELTTNTEKFADDNEIAPYAYDAVYIIKNMGVINGHENGCFEPLGTLTRGQAAKLIYEILG